PVGPNPARLTSGTPDGEAINTAAVRGGTGGEFGDWTPVPVHNVNVDLGPTLWLSYAEERDLLPIGRPDGGSVVLRWRSARTSGDVLESTSVGVHDEEVGAAVGAIGAREDDPTRS